MGRELEVGGEKVSGALNLTRQWLEARRLDLLFAGDMWQMTFKVLDENGLEVDLTGATLWSTTRRKVDGGVIITRKSGEVITGTLDEQIEILDQVTNRGKFILRFGSVAADADLLYADIEIHRCDLRIEDASGKRDTLADGEIEFLQPQTRSFN